MLTPVLIALTALTMFFTLAMGVFSRLYHEVGLDTYRKISNLFYMGIIICIAFIIVFAILSMKYEGAV